MAATAVAAPYFWIPVRGAARTVRHASFGAGGQALSDINAFAKHEAFELVAVADVDLCPLDQILDRFPKARVYQDWRELLKEEHAQLDSINVSTPDHMHAPITMRAIARGLNVYTQKPLTQTLYEARQLAKAAHDKGVVSQMGIQIHSHPVHKTVVALIQSGAIGKVKEIHSWSGKQWGDHNPRPDRTDPVPDGLDWNGWIGVAVNDEPGVPWHTLEILTSDLEVEDGPVPTGGLVVSPDGSRMLRRSLGGEVLFEADAVALGHALADELLGLGAAGLMGTGPAEGGAK